MLNKNKKKKMELSNKILSDITVYMKYAKYIPELNRRETWNELVTRNKNMHIKKYPDLKDQIEKAKNFITKNKNKEAFITFLKTKNVGWVLMIAYVYPPYDSSGSWPIY